MSKQRIEIEVDVPEGHECTGEFQPGVLCDGVTKLIGGLILRKVEPVKETRYGWVCARHSTAESARTKHDGKIDVVRCDFEDGKLVNVALEPAHGEPAP